MDGRSVDSARVDVAAQLLCRAWHAKGGRAYAHVHPRDDAGVTGHHTLFLGFRARHPSGHKEFSAKLRAGIEYAFEEEDKPMIALQQAQVGDRGTEGDTAETQSLMP